MGPEKNKMNDISRNSKSKVNIWMQKNSDFEEQHPINCGEVLLCIRYVPPQQKLTINLIEIRNLTSGIIQPIKTYIQIRLFDGDECFAKQKTTVKKANSSLFLGEHFVFNVPLKKTNNIKVVLAMKRHNRFKGGEKLMEASLQRSQSESASQRASLNVIFEKPGSRLQHWCTFHKTTDAYNSKFLEL